MKDKEMIVGIGDWGNLPHHAIPRNKHRIVKQNPYLLRECPGCGREVLRYRQKFCDECSRRRRQKSKQKYYRKVRCSST